MDKELVDRVVTELHSILIGNRLRSVLQIGKPRLLLNFEGNTFERLLVSLDPRDNRLYLIRRRDRDVKKQTIHPSKFVIDVEARLVGARVERIENDESERIVSIRFEPDSLVIQLTGSSSNAFLLDSSDTIISSFRSVSSPGQRTGDLYSFKGNRLRDPQPLQGKLHAIALSDTGSVSQELEAYYTEIDEQYAFEQLAASVKTRHKQLVRKVDKLITNLKNDLVEHGDAEKWKYIGNVLLANQASAVRAGEKLQVIDVYDPEQRLIEIEASPNDSVIDAANKYFRRFTKARNAASEILGRIEKAEIEKRRLFELGSEIEGAIERRDINRLRDLETRKKRQTPAGRKRKSDPDLPGVRTYVSSDGFEIMVGKKAADNDVLTQRIARSRDIWMHAADYPGSHVVIRNSTRKPIPQQTLIEAAQLAAFFSQGNKQTKAAVNYTEKKYVMKPKGAAAGLVRLASFKTVLVEPIFPNVTNKH